MIDLSLRPPFITTATTTLLCLITLTASTSRRRCSIIGGLPEKMRRRTDPLSVGIQSDPPGCAMPGLRAELQPHHRRQQRPCSPCCFSGTWRCSTISLPEGQVRMKMDMTYDCYNTSTHKPECVDRANLNFTGSPFTFSNTANKFTVLGCRMLAFLGPGNQRDVGKQPDGGLLRELWQRRRSRRHQCGGCSGTGCCQTAVPKGIKHYKVWFDDRFNTSTISNWSRCSYGALVEETSFQFSKIYNSSRNFSVASAGQPPFVWTGCWEVRRAGRRRETLKPTRATASNSVLRGFAQRTRLRLQVRPRIPRKSLPAWKSTVAKVNFASN
ncbi:hypothetical protein GUJ93_ZPchr0004g38270 [Zizania palustris]|uniref:Uncharacterized protein n=1 Tax=Zizania palustris TaxID=103762 RepID=A0A8J5S9X1_ZIZPA|nr:hypothetical protein GUJ93_ZPchr0004g38270 [Zizania palustris]